MALSKWEVLNLRVGWNKIGLANQHSLNAKKSKKKIVTEKKSKFYLGQLFVFYYSHDDSVMSQHDDA